MQAGATMEEIRFPHVPNGAGDDGSENNAREAMAEESDSEAIVFGEWSVVEIGPDGLPAESEFSSVQFQATELPATAFAGSATQQSTGTAQPESAPPEFGLVDFQNGIPNEEPAREEREEARQEEIDAGAYQSRVSQYAPPPRPPQYGSGRQGNSRAIRINHQVSVGRIFSITLATFRGNVMFFLLLGVLACLPATLMTLFGDRRIGVIKICIDWVFSTIFMGAISYAVYQNLIGKVSGFTDAVTRGFSRFFPIIVICLLTFSFFFVVILFSVLMPGIFIIGSLILCLYLLCQLAVLYPACMVEKLGPIASIGRSAGLTKGYRWQIFGMFVLYFFFVVGISIVLNLFLGSGGRMGINIPQLILDPITTAFRGIMLAVLYFQLRAAKEGVSIDKLANVFD